ARLETPHEELDAAGAYVSVDTPEHNYLLALIAGQEMQYRLTSALLGEAGSGSPLFIRDAMGEITNMIAGLTKSQMSQTEGTDLTLGLPFFINGQYFGTSAARNRSMEQVITVENCPCKLIVIQQQLSGQA